MMLVVTLEEQLALVADGHLTRHHPRSRVSGVVHSGDSFVVLALLVGKAFWTGERH